MIGKYSEAKCVTIQGHVKAMQHVRGFYLEWRVERLRLVVGEGAKEWDIVNWAEGSVCPFGHA